MNLQDQVIEYALNKAAATFADDIDLLVCYGSYITGNVSELSDVDLFYVPRTDKRDLSETFILNGVGYDIFALSWETLAEIAAFKNGLSPLLGDSKILYQFSETEGQHFDKLIEQMQQNLKDTDYMQQQARERMKFVCKQNQLIQSADSLSQVRENAGHLLLALAEAIAYTNQTYFHTGVKEQYQNLQEFAELPKDCMTLYDKLIVANSVEQIQSLCQQLFDAACKFTDYQPASFDPLPQSDTEDTLPDYQQAASWYEECCSTFNKIYACVQTKNTALAFLSAACLQSSLKQDLSISLKTTDLMSYFAADNLAPLAAQAKRIQHDCVDRILAGNGTLREYQTIQELYQATL